MIGSTRFRWLGLGLLALLATESRVTASTRPAAPRRVVVLDGTWQIAESSNAARPREFTHEVPVPGLVDVARPSFEQVGKKSSLRQAFWYRKSFRVDGAVPDVALLKVAKACYGTHAWMNGKDLGEHVGCFTPGYFDVRGAVRGEGAENELVVRLGADRESIPPDTPSGWDFEKYLFTPGIYDSVELILTGAPFIENVQIVPDLATSTTRAIVEVRGGPTAGEVHLTTAVREAKSGAAVGSGDAAVVPLEAGKVRTVELRVSIPKARLWSPEDPFLYAMTIGTGADAVDVRFGMRSFRFDPAGKRALLNGQPYYLRGTNVCIFRFFEDAARGDKPWREDWVRRLHQQFRTMHWNAIRYCIGFPPEAWYDIADEEGFLIQDEFPIWLLSPDAKSGGPPENPKAERIIPQYVEGMRERWNHPCVVIWDAQNESFTEESGKAVRAVRHLDLSDRPWENGWGEPQSPTDCVESHPYLFMRAWNGGKPFRLSEMPNVSGVPNLQGPQRKRDVPILINEYCWLWLNRDGTPTCLTDRVYEGLLGKDSTTEQRRMAHARNLAALTEFWRCHRECAGVLHFCGLGYSRAGNKPRPEGGATSDHWIDLEKLVFEPLMAEYLGEAFDPVGLMLDFWKEDVSPGATEDVRVFAIDDLPEAWSGTLTLQVRKGDRAVSEESRPLAMPAFGQTVVTVPLTFPTEPGDYTLVASRVRGDEKPVRSLRDFRVRP